MPVLTVYPHGGKGGVAPRKNDHMRMKRGVVEGWSAAAVRRNTEFLMSVDVGALTGAGCAVTLTLRDCPPSPDAWHKLRRAWLERMRRAGMIRLHWVTEWQRRGVPHLHCAIWFPDAYRGQEAVEAWCAVAAEFGASVRGQHWRVITGPVGWFQYLAKHAARGVAHYQRSAAGIPPAWRSRTGRVWGHVGAWTLVEPRRFALQGADGDGGWYRFRRMLRGWATATARASGDAYRVRAARRMLRCGDRQQSMLRGFREWMPAEAVQLRMIAGLAALGFAVVDRDTGELLWMPTPAVSGPPSQSR